MAEKHYSFPRGKNNPRYQAKYDHSLYQTRIYRVWSNMKTRCYNPKSQFYKDYGGRGITISKEWQTFDGFYKDMKKDYKENLTLDRIDNNKGYSRKNCKWSTRKEQANNTRHIDKATRFAGKTITEWSKITGIKRSTLGMRLQQYKWPLEKALGGAF